MSGELILDCQSENDSLIMNAEELSSNVLILDTHIDVPYRLNRQWEDISMSTEGHFDYPRAFKGGLNSAFMSINIR